MAKAKSSRLLREIARLASSIHLKHGSMGEAGKKDLALIHKHLRKALKAIDRNIPGKAAARRKTAARTARKRRSPKPAMAPKQNPQVQ